MILGRDEILRLIKNEPPLIEGYLDLGTQLQPAGFDLTVNRIYVPEEEGEIDFSNERRKIPRWRELNMRDDAFLLKPGAYIISYNEKVNLPLNIAAIVKPRSSLLRMGATIATALWDPGYRGRGKSLLIVFNPHGIRLHRNARVAQMIFLLVTGGTGAGYKGLFQHEK